MKDLPIDGVIPKIVASLEQANSVVIEAAPGAGNKSVPGTLSVIRMGGDEFLAILVDSSPDKTIEVAERIRSSMAANRFEIASRPHKITLSLGVSVYPIDSTVFEECMRAADLALYAAKRAGCNRVVRCTREMIETKR